MLWEKEVIFRPFLKGQFRDCPPTLSTIPLVPQLSKVQAVPGGELEILPLASLLRRLQVQGSKIPFQMAFELVKCYGLC